MELLIFFYSGRQPELPVSMLSRATFTCAWSATCSQYISFISSSAATISMHACGCFRIRSLVVHSSQPTWLYRNGPRIPQRPFLVGNVWHKLSYSIEWSLVRCTGTVRLNKRYQALVKNWRVALSGTTSHLFRYIHTVYTTCWTSSLRQLFRFSKAVNNIYLVVLSKTVLTLHVLIELMSLQLVGKYVIYCIDWRQTCTWKYEDFIGLNLLIRQLYHHSCLFYISCINWSGPSMAYLGFYQGAKYYAPNERAQTCPWVKTSWPNLTRLFPKTRPNHAAQQFH